MGLDAIQPIRTFLRDTRYTFSQLTGRSRAHAKLHVMGPHEPLYPGGPSEAALVERVEHSLGDIEAGQPGEKHTIHGGRVNARSLSMAAGMAVLCRAHCTVGSGSMDEATEQARATLASDLRAVQKTAPE